MEDIVLSASSDAPQDFPKSLKVVSPSKVILDNITSQSIDVEATSAILTGGKKAKIEELHFRSNSDSDSEDLVTGLFIERDSELEIESLSLEDALLMNSGTLRIKKEMNLNGGYFLNAGIISTTADPAILQNISYMLNGENGKIEASGKLILESNVIANAGEIKAGEINAIVSKNLQNTGSIEAKSVSLASLSDIQNDGVILSDDMSKIDTGKLSNTGQIKAKNNVIITKTLLQNEGEIKGEMVDLSGESFEQVAGTIKSDKKVMKFSDGKISGVFFNEKQDSVNFAKTIELTGKSAYIQNDGNFYVNEIISSSEEGVVNGGEISATNIKANKYLQLSTKAEKLQTATTDATGSLFIDSATTTPNLLKIVNFGNTEILAKTPNLTYINNNGKLKIDACCSLPNLTNLDNNAGTLKLGGSLPNLKSLNIQNGASFVASSYANLSNLTDLTVQSSAKFSAEANVNLSSLSMIQNFGTAVFNSELKNLNLIGNRTGATLHLLNKTATRGDVSNDGDIVLRNELNIKGNYKSSKNAKLKFEDGSRVTAYDFINNGTIYSPTALKITQNGTVTKFGKVDVEDGITYDINFGNLNFDKINPIIRKKDGVFKVKTNKEINISSPTTFTEFNLDIEAPNFYVNSNFKVKNLKLKTSKFTNTGMITSRENIFVEADSFTNTMGTIKSLQDMKFVVKGTFINTGEKISHKDKQTITYYTLKEIPKTVISLSAAQNCGLAINNYTLPGKNSSDKLAYVEPEQKTEIFCTEIYSAKPDKQGRINCGNNLDVSANSINNSYSFLSANKTIKLNSVNSIDNNCGTIVSGESTTISGNILYNGISKGGQSINGIDQNSPIITQVSIQKPIIVKSDKTRTAHSDCGCTSIKFNIPMTKLVDGGTFPVITGYSSKIQYTSASKSPGHIYSVGDLNLNIKREAYLGDIVSEKDIYLQGNPLVTNINSADRGRMIARGNISAAIKNDLLNQIQMEAENIATHVVDSINFRGADYKISITTSDGNVVEKVDLAKFSELCGLVYKAVDFNFKSVLPLLSPPEISSGKYLIEPLRHYSSVGLIGRQPSMTAFLPMIKRNIMKQVVKVVLTRVIGRDVILNDNLVDQLEAAGQRYAKTLTSSQKVDYLALTDGKPMIVYEQSNEKDAEFETTDGEKVIAPILTPYLIYNSISRMQHCVQKAANTLQYISDEDINVFEEIKDHAKNVELLAPNGGINFISERKYDEFGKEYIDKAGVTIPGHLLIESKKDINALNAKFDIGGNMTLRSKEGNVNLPPSFREIHTFLKDGTIITKTEAEVTEIKVREKFLLETPNGRSNIAVKGDSIQTQDLDTLGIAANFYGPKESRSLEKVQKNSIYKCKQEYVPQATVKVYGTATLDAYDNNLKSVTLDANKTVKETPGNVTLQAQECECEEYSYKKKGNFWGRSSTEVKQNYTYYATSELNSDKLKLTGEGALVNEGGLIKNNKQLITKNRIDKTPMGKHKICVHNEGSGFFAPRVKADTLEDALKVLKRVEGATNLAAAGLNMVGAVSQTGTQALKVIESLQGLQNPFMVMAQVGLSRFVQGPSIGSYSNTYQRTEKIPQRPVMISKDSTIINAETHKEGIDIFDKSVFQTENFTENYPKHTVEEKRESRSFRANFAIAGMIAALVSGNPVLAFPNISANQASSTQRQETDIKGITTTESHSKQTNMGLNTAALFAGNTAQYEFMDPRFGAIPSYSKELREARVVTDSQGRVLKEEHKSSTTNPLISEFFNCVMQVNEFSTEFNKIRAQYIRDRVIEGESMEKAREEAEEIDQKTFENIKKVKEQKQQVRQKLKDNIQKIAGNIETDKESAQRLAGAIKSDVIDINKEQILSIIQQTNLEEIAIDVEKASVLEGKSKATRSFLEHYAEVEMFQDQLDRNQDLAVCGMYCEAAETFNHLMIPGYAAYAAGGDALTIANDAMSDVLMTYCGGKVVQIAGKAVGKAWTFGKQLAQGVFVKPVVVEAKVAEKLNWDHIIKNGETRIQHIQQEHTFLKLSKSEQGIFYGDPSSKINTAWSKVAELDIKPIKVGNVDYYVVPMENVGYAGGSNSAVRDVLHHLTIMTEHDTANLINAFPTYKAGPNQLKEFINSQLFLGVK